MHTSPRTLSDVNNVLPNVTPTQSFGSPGGAEATLDHTVAGLRMLRLRGRDVAPAYLGSMELDLMDTLAEVRVLRAERDAAVREAAALRSRRA